MGLLGVGGVVLLLHCNSIPLFGLLSGVWRWQPATWQPATWPPRAGEKKVGGEDGGNEIWDL